MTPNSLPPLLPLLRMLSFDFTGTSPLTSFLISNTIHPIWINQFHHFFSFSLTSYLFWCCLNVEHQLNLKPQTLTFFSFVHQNQKMVKFSGIHLQSMNISQVFFPFYSFCSYPILEIITSWATVLVISLGTIIFCFHC